ncbi:hypothetical protein ACRYCC_13810 [Actinomadura scrupuli]|uniref:hypothetical protein n=1 Tax=Actinomadura scrupuli TaxID=559629 RepID=UPI003D96AB16
MTRTSPARARLAGTAHDRLRLLGMGLAGLAGLASVAACGAQAEGGKSPTAEQTTVMSRYVQTWSKSYDRTSCAEWSARMTDRQRWTAALDMLKNARAADDAFAVVPPDRLVDRFRRGVDARCGAAATDPATDTVAGAGARVYLSGKRAYHP